VSTEKIKRNKQMSALHKTGGTKKNNQKQEGRKKKTETRPSGEQQKQPCDTRVKGQKGGCGTLKKICSGETMGQEGGRKEGGRGLEGAERKSLAILLRTI